MADIVLQCKRKAETAIYNHLVRAGYADRLDNGFRVLNYNNPSRPKDNLEGAGDGKVVCEELWENALILLDGWGESESTRQKYDELRKIIEVQTRRSIPWVLDDPDTRRKVDGAVKELNKILADIKKQDEAKYQRCLIACLYWFVFSGEDGRIIPLDFISFMEEQRIPSKTVDQITRQFSEYLQRTGGGFGLMAMGDEDAVLEATALETIIHKRGACTEQSKVMYAVLRMAGIKAFFVESHPSVEYFQAKRLPTRVPLQGHMASGVGAKVIDQNGEEKVWIVDMALKQLEADYIFDGPGWKAHSYWELSLRHFYMTDLSNLGRNQTGLGDLARAEQSLSTALQMGEDSAAFFCNGEFRLFVE